MSLPYPGTDCPLYAESSIQFLAVHWKTLVIPSSTNRRPSWFVRRPSSSVVRRRGSWSSWSVVVPSWLVGVKFYPQNPKRGIDTIFNHFGESQRAKKGLGGLVFPSLLDYYDFSGVWFRPHWVQIPYSIEKQKRQTFFFRFCKYRLCFHILYIHS